MLCLRAILESGTHQYIKNKDSDLYASNKLEGLGISRLFKKIKDNKEFKKIFSKSYIGKIKFLLQNDYIDLLNATAHGGTLPDKDMARKIIINSEDLLKAIFSNNSNP